MQRSSSECESERRYESLKFSNSRDERRPPARPSQTHGIANRRNRIRVTEHRGPEARATATSASESQRNDSEEKNTLLQHQTNTDVAVTVARSEVEAVRTTNEDRRVVPGAAPQNAERPRATDPSPSAAKPCGFSAELPLCSDRVPNASLSDGTNPWNFQTRATGSARRKHMESPIAGIASE